MAINQKQVLSLQQKLSLIHICNANEHDPQYTYDAWDNDELR